MESSEKKEEENEDSNNENESPENNEDKETSCDLVLQEKDINLKGLIYHIGWAMMAFNVQAKIWEYQNNSTNCCKLYLEVRVHP